MSRLPRTIKTYFTGTVDELKEYRKDPVMGVLFAVEIGATIWGLNDFENGTFNMVALPFAVDMLSRGVYSAIHYISDRRQLKYNLTKHLKVEEASKPEVQEGVNRIVDKMTEGYFPPGLIGIIRQRGKYKPMIGTLDD